MAAATALREPTTPYEQHREYVLRVLARRCGWLDGGEREEALHDAYVVMLERERKGDVDLGAMHSQQVRAFLVQTAINKALDAGKRVGRKRSQPLAEAESAPDPARSPDELVAATLDGARVREIVAELPERRQAVVKLRFFFDRTPAEIQRCLHISERAYRKEIERAVHHIADRYELVRAGRFCDSRRSLVLAYVAGVAGPNRAREAREHLASCPGCAAWAAELRDASRRVAAALPAPVVVTEGELPGGVASVVDSARDAATQLSGWLKQQAAALVTRVDPSGAGQVAGVKPGAAAAAIASCVAIGGGATYCAVEGIPEPLRPAFVDRAIERKPAEASERPAPEPSPPAPVPPPATEPSPAPAAAPASTARGSAAQGGGSSTGGEFGLEAGTGTRSGRGGTGSGTTASAASTGGPTQSSPTSPSGSGGSGSGGEFGLQGSPAPSPTAPAPTSGGSTSGGGEFGP